MPMQKLLVAVTVVGCLSRFRNGIQFSTKPKQISVTEQELATLQADSYLNVKVLEDTPADDENTGTDPTADTGKDDSDDKKPDESKTSHDELDKIVEGIRALNLDVDDDKPTCAYLKEQGIEASAKLRDEAWDVLVGESVKGNTNGGAE